jgi:eukaryotic-like serine/threonine-protein kinase
MGRHDSGSARHSDPWMPRRSGQAADSPPGEIELPGYRDFVPIARSEGSEVYRAYQDGLDRPVAVKVLLLDDPDAVARFHREVEITVQLGRQHPHIVTVIDTGTTSDGRPCIVMEHYDRGSLHDRLRAGGPLAWAEVLAAGTVVADALSFAHRYGVLHRDVKPQNILVLPTSYVVADFGIARRIDAVRTTSVEWFSFRHAAPQVLDGEPPAVADDIWSVGSTLFTLLDGHPPFAVGNAEEDTALAYMKRVRTGRPRTLKRPDVPAGLVAIIDHCLQHERSDRFPDAAALHAELVHLAAGARAWAPAGAPPPPPPAGAGGLTGHGPAHPTSAPPQAAQTDTPGVLSPSALAQLVASQVTTGGQAAGDVTIGPRYGEPSSGANSAPVTAAAGGGLRRILVGTAVALLIGGVLGIGGTWVARQARGEADESSQGQEAAPGSSPLPAGAGPTGTAGPSATRQSIVNPKLAPEITRITAVDRTTVRLRWADRSAGKAQFVVVRIFSDTGKTSSYVVPGRDTQYEVRGLDPATAPFCFHVLALTTDENGRSDRRCVSPPG